MADEDRTRRVAMRIREIVATVIEWQIKDPRLGMVTITDVRVTADYRQATVFYTVWGDEVVQADSAAALASATGVIRSAVGRGTGLKHTPSLAFVLDAMPENAKHIDDVLAAARAADERLQEAARRARPAGDPDPYRHAD